MSVVRTVQRPGYTAPTAATTDDLDRVLLTSVVVAAQVAYVEFPTVFKDNPEYPSYVIEGMWHHSNSGGDSNFSMHYMEGGARYGGGTHYYQFGEFAQTTPSGTTASSNNYFVLDSGHQNNTLLGFKMRVAPRITDIVPAGGGTNMALKKPYSCQLFSLGTIYSFKFSSGGFQSATAGPAVVDGIAFSASGGSYNIMPGSSFHIYGMRQEGFVI